MSSCIFFGVCVWGGGGEAGRRDASGGSKIFDLRIVFEDYFRLLDLSSKVWHFSIIRTFVEILDLRRV